MADTGQSPYFSNLAIFSGAGKDSVSNQCQTEPQSEYGARMFGLRLNESSMSLVSGNAGSREAAQLVGVGAFHQLIDAEESLKPGVADRACKAGTECDGKWPVVTYLPANVSVPCANDMGHVDLTSDRPLEHGTPDFVTVEMMELSETGQMPVILEPARAILMGISSLDRAVSEAIRAEEAERPVRLVETGRSVPRPQPDSDDSLYAVMASKQVFPSRSDEKAVLSRMEPQRFHGIGPVAIERQPVLAMEMTPTDSLQVPRRIPDRLVGASMGTRRAAPQAAMPVTSDPGMASAPARPLIAAVGENARFEPVRDAAYHPAPVSSASPALVRVHASSDDPPLIERPHEVSRATSASVIHVSPDQGIEQRASPLRFTAFQGVGVLLQDQVVALLRNPSQNVIQIQFDPTELGAVRISLKASEAGLQVHVFTERPETLELLRKFSADLIRDLTQMGYKDLSMCFSDQREDGAPRNMPDEKAEKGAAENSSPVIFLDIPLGPLSEQGGIDIRV